MKKENREYPKPKYIIKNDKYSIDILLEYETPNGTNKKGLNIYKQNCEISSLNEENLSNFDIKNTNYIYSFANFGLIKINDIVCFIYATQEDIIPLNNDEEDPIIYKLKNLKYIVMKDNDIEEFDNIFNEYKKYMINEGLMFYYYRYSNNILNNHMSFSLNYNNFVFNNKYLYLFKNSNTLDFITPLIKGAYYNFIENNISYEILLKIINLDVYKEKENLIDKDELINDKECIIENEILIKSYKNLKCVFYSYYGKNCSDINFINNLIGEENMKNNLIFGVFEKNTNFNIENKINELKKESKKEKKMFIITNSKKEEINKLINDNINTLNEYFSENDLISNVNKTHLLLLGINNNSIYFMTENIIQQIINFYLEKINNNNDKYSENVKKQIKNFFFDLDERFGKRLMYLFKIKMPKISYINADYINENNKENKENIENKDNKENKDTKENKISNDASIPFNDNLNKNSRVFFHIFILTYNVCGMNLDNINRIDTNNLLFPKKTGSFFNTEKNLPLFYIIGLEEAVELNPKNVIIGGENIKIKRWEEKLTLTLKSKSNYYLLAKEVMVGIVLFVFVKISELNNISKIKLSKLKSGFFGQLGNKGECFINFEYKGKKIGINCGHLTSGQANKDNNQRKQTLIKVLEYNFDDDKNEKFYQNDFYFLLGDLNFRVNNNINILHKWIEDLHGHHNNELETIDKKKNENVIDNKLFVDDDNDKEESQYYQISEKIFMKSFGDDYWKYDQLNIFKDQLIKYDIKEKFITFPPSYKYIKYSNNYNILKRGPSWTDRILYKENGLINSLFYDRIEDVNYSDHKPVFSIFEIKY